jgi:hypothetical protein
VARGFYTPQSYRDFIGFEFDQAGLERAFLATYGIPLSELLSSSTSIGTFRFAVSKLIPEMTYVAWQNKHKDIEKLHPGTTRQSFVYSLSRADYEKKWGFEYEKPGFTARLLAFFLRFLPPIGPLGNSRFRVAPPEGEKLFLETFENTVVEYRKALDEVRRNRLALGNFNLDTGMPTRPGEYRMADKAYAKLVEKLDNENFEHLTPDLRANITTFYAGYQPGPDDRKLLARLERLRKARITTSLRENREGVTE